MRDADGFMVRKIGVSNRRGSGAVGISILETVLNGDADQIGGAPRPQLGLDLAAVVRGGLVADTEGTLAFRPRRSPHSALEALERAVMTQRVNWVLDLEHPNLLRFCRPRMA